QTGRRRQPSLRVAFRSADRPPPVDPPRRRAAVVPRPAAVPRGAPQRPRAALRRGGAPGAGVGRGALARRVLQPGGPGRVQPPPAVLLHHELREEGTSAPVRGGGETAPRRPATPRPIIP